MWWILIILAVFWWAIPLLDRPRLSAHDMAKYREAFEEHRKLFTADQVANIERRLAAGDKEVRRLRTDV